MLATEQLAKLRTRVVEPDQLVTLFDALGDPCRLKVLGLLRVHKELCVTELATVLGMSMSAVSHQLRYLRLAGLVTSYRDGKMICYRLADDALPREVRKLLKRLA